MYTSKTGQYDVLSVETWPVESIIKSQVAGYKKCVVSVFLQISVCVLAKL